MIINFKNIILKERLTDSYYIKKNNEFEQELKSSYINPLYISQDYLIPIKDYEFKSIIKEDYQEEIEKYFLDFERYCIKAIKEELISDHLDHIIR